MHALAMAVRANLPVILWGAPGTGKTSAVLALGERLGLPVEVVVGSVREPSDFAGLPVVRDGGTWFAPPRWAERLASAGGGILFLDELTTAPPAVQAAMLRVVLERVVGDLALPASVRVVAAANPPALAADGWDLSAPLANRFVHLDWVVGAASVADGFTGGFVVPELAGVGPGGSLGVARALVGAFLRVRPSLVLAVPEDSGRAWPSPRTWELAAAALACTTPTSPAATVDGRGGRAGTTTPHDLPGTATPHGGSGGSRPEWLERVRAELVVGAVGEAAGFELLSWVRDLDLPDPETLLSDPEAPLPDRVDRLHAVLGSVVAHVHADGGGESWQRAWTLVARAARRTPDVAAGAARTLATRRPAGTPLPPAMLELAPILRAAGLMP
ncbi:ATP-binding protein [Nonomuraea sp. NPDC050790]|uniref:ATP-binding protein n=1 Tax=Nonomuraea sp. NPDC050790 TaxID=3364371 RepID=UPI0037A02F90